MQGLPPEAIRFFIAKEIVSLDEPVPVSVSNFTEDIQEIISDALEKTEHTNKRTRPQPVEDLLEEYWSQPSALRNHPLFKGEISTQDEYEEGSCSLQQSVQDESEQSSEPIDICY